MIASAPAFLACRFCFLFGGIPAFFSAERYTLPWRLWRLATMFAPRFYFLYHQADGTSGWSEGWWVSGQTNDVYAYIGG